MRVESATELGGKIAQMVDRRTGRKWPERHPRLAWCLPATRFLITASAGIAGPTNDERA
ncbi:MAG TPA: hypothetical protein VFL17_24080 [Anaerolineae bacterium]|nr:hypothetical protein [Anaerolineae bacterium]